MFGKFFIYDEMDYAQVVRLEMKQINNLMSMFGIDFESPMVSESLQVEARGRGPSKMATLASALHGNPNRKPM